jgi:hypothetical protein
VLEGIGRGCHQGCRFLGRVKLGDLPHGGRVKGVEWGSDLEKVAMEECDRKEEV